jgi:phosphocarrier protein HPr
MTERLVRVAAHEGLHARPAADFVRAVKESGAAVTISFNGRTADARSLLAVLTLGVAEGDEVTISAEGEDEEAVAALAELLETA